MPSRTSPIFTSSIGKSSKQMDLEHAGLQTLRMFRCISWGYPTESAYYRDASSSDSVLAVRIPYLAIQAADDPVSFRPKSSHRRKRLLTVRRSLWRGPFPTRSSRRIRIPFASRRPSVATSPSSRWAVVDGMQSRYVALEPKSLSGARDVLTTLGDQLLETHGDENRSQVDQ